MQEQVRHMVTAGHYSIKLAIRHVRQPDQWIPVATFDALERPNDARPRQPLLDHRGLIHVQRIIDITEAIVARGPITGQDSEGEDEATDQAAPSSPSES